MNIKVRKNNDYKDVKISYAGTTIDLGLLDEEEVQVLINNFKYAIELLEAK